MIMLIFSIITCIIAIFLVLAVVFKKPKRLSHVAFSVGLFATVCVTFGDTMAVLRPEQFSIWKIITSASESLMAPSWLLFTLSFARTSYGRTMGRFPKLLLLLSPVFLFLLLIKP